MLLTFVFALTLIALGLLHASGFVGDKIPASRHYIAKLPPYETYIGLAGIGLGIFILLSSISFFRGFGMLVGILASVTALSLGLLSGAQFLKDGVFHNNPVIKTKIDNAIVALSAQKQTFGIAGIVLGFLSLLLSIFGF